MVSMRALQMVVCFLMDTPLFGRGQEEIACRIAICFCSSVLGNDAASGEILLSECSGTGDRALGQ